MAKLVRSKQKGLAMKRIVCIGNNTEDTAHRAQLIADQYALPCQGLAVMVDQPSGVCYTDLGTISQEQFLLLGEQSDLVIMLDQPVNSYDHQETYAHTLGCCHWLKRVTRVVFENQLPDVYITVSYVPPNRFNTELHQVKDNAQIIEKLTTINITGRRVFVEFGPVIDINDFILILNSVLGYSTSADFVIFRASPHEAPEVHRAVTLELFKTKEFAMLTPAVFNNDYKKNIQLILENHWQWLYGAQKPEYYHTVYTQL